MSCLQLQFTWNTSNWSIESTTIEQSVIINDCQNPLILMIWYSCWNFNKTFLLFVFINIFIDIWKWREREREKKQIRLWSKHFCVVRYLLEILAILTCRGSTFHFPALLSNCTTTWHHCWVLFFFSVLHGAPVFNSDYYLKYSTVGEDVQHL